MSENGDRTEQGPRAVKNLEDCVEDSGGGEGVGERALDTMAAAEIVPNVVAEPRSYTSQEINDMTPDQAHAAVARGLPAVSQMQRLLGGPPLTTEKLLRRPLAAEAKAAEEDRAAAEATSAAEATAAAEAKAAAESKAAEGDDGSPGMRWDPGPRRRSKHKLYLFECGS